MTEATTVIADGYTGKASFDGATIRIDRPGVKGKIGYGNKPSEIDASTVSRIAFQEPTLMTNGSITFVVPGQALNLEAMDPNTVLFTRKQKPDFEALRDAVVAVAGPDTGKAIVGTAQYAAHSVANGIYTTGTVRRDIVGATAEFESGADRSRPTLTRVGAGALLLGPVGAVGGALLKKNTTKCYVTVIFSDGDTVIIEGPTKDETKMRKFAADVNRIAAN